MAIHTLDQNLTAVAAVSAPVTAAAVTSAAIDTQGYRRALVVVAAKPTGAGTTVNVLVQECATSGGSYTTVVGTDTSIAHTMADGTTPTGFATTVGGLATLMINIDLAKRQRFLQVVTTGAGASAAGAEAATVLLYEPLNLGTATGANSIHV